jgi:hypothetical protein
MRPLSSDGLSHLLALADLSVAKPTLGIGSELTHRAIPPRRVIIHFGENESPGYLVGVALRVLELDSEWVLYPRNGSIRDLALPAALPEGSAVCFSENERAELAKFLCTRPMGPESVATDLYVIGKAGQALVTWDHHTSAEGLVVALQSIADASRLLASLNEFGAELELVCSSG